MRRLKNGRLQASKLVILLFIAGLILGVTLGYKSAYNIKDSIGKLLTPFPKKALCRKCNIILISIDALRADDLPCYGYPRNTAPNLCAFANKNVMFTQAYTQSSFTLDSHMSILTSLYPSTHQVLYTLKDILSPNIVTLPQILKNNGYKTTYVGYLDADMFPLDKGWERGFDEFVRNDNELEGWNKGFEKFINSVKRGQPTFMFMHTDFVHDPYLIGRTNKRFFATEDRYLDIPLTQNEYSQFDDNLRDDVLKEFQFRVLLSDSPTSLKRNQEIYDRLKNAKNIKEAETIFKSFPYFEQNSFYAKRYWQNMDASNYDKAEYFRALYEERIHQLDNELKKLFNFFSDPLIAKNTILVITADHGEEFKEHGVFRHGKSIYNAATHVPLIISLPQVKDKRFKDMVQSIDIYPTLLGLTGIASPPWVQGIDLTKLISSNPDATRNQYLVSEYRGGIIRSIRNMRWKFYWYSMENDRHGELYDLLVDQEEQHNVFDQHPEIVKRLSQALDDILKKKPIFPKVESQFPAWIDAAKRKKIIEEGYF